ncbi:MAG: ABC transporter permease [Lachnospiraceae bacterium]|nr:ABC transporter permease [Lachnospiraceae bacterium]
MRNIIAIFQKQVKETFKNKTILIQFIMFPLMAIIMENTVKIEGMPDNFFVNLFSSMYIGMAPLTSMASIISEEKEKNTLRVLMMSQVKPMQYLIGTGSYIWGICMIGACVLGLTGTYEGKELVAFLGIMAVGILASLLMGAAIGTWSHNQMSATSLTMPVMFVFSFLPMLSMFNEAIDKIARLVYSDQIYTLLNNMGYQSGYQLEIALENVAVVGVNMAVAILFFAYAYKKSGLA